MAALDLNSPGSIRLFDDAAFAWRRHGPSRPALRAFGVREDALRRLPGGSGVTWTDDRLVLKPVGCVPEHDWVCSVYTDWACDDVRVPQPVSPRTPDNDAWSVEGWGAHVFVEGRDLDLEIELAAVKEASDAFHHHLRGLPRPEFIATRNDPWAYGDRLAWESARPADDPDSLELIERLMAHCRPVVEPPQLIHGDILPNVLVAEGKPLAVIDWPPYYRPVGMANAIAVTDAVTFRGASPSLLDKWETGTDWGQMLVRALLYRLGTTGLIASRNRLMGSLVTHVERARPVVDGVLARVQSD